jgi:hypothetical protein
LSEGLLVDGGEGSKILAGESVLSAQATDPMPGLGGVAGLDRVAGEDAHRQRMIGLRDKGTAKFCQTLLDSILLEEQQGQFDERARLVGLETLGVAQLADGGSDLTGACELSPVRVAQRG